MSGIIKIISGGQTGVDRSALMAARDLGFDTGGWCPPGRSSEDGIIPIQFPLQETPDDRSQDAPDIPRSQRTEWNVRDSDATLIIVPEKNLAEDPGTKWTMKCAIKYNKPFIVCNSEKENASWILKWIKSSSITVLNIAGPSENSFKGITEKAYLLIHSVLSNLLK
jgi:hypothetical protein